jgi:FlaA1/EpsC-like NDP-sugar epimerase
MVGKQMTTKLNYTTKLIAVHGSSNSNEVDLGLSSTRAYADADIFTANTAPHRLSHARATMVVEASYEPSSILITGGAGFIASHVVSKLVRAEPRVKVSVCFPRFAVYLV